MKKTGKTNAMRLVEKSGAPYELCSYEYDEKSMDAVSAAKRLSVSAESVFKTLVTRNDKGEIFVFCIPGNCELDLKKAAKTAGSKRVELVKVRELLALTGYVRGGCSPIGMKRTFPICIDESATISDWIYINAGARGLQLKIQPSDLANILDAEFADIV
jgi:Cys-tRNA(Pro)/Cys-tRNA(Cys) deacylase